jgi:phospholipase C
VPPLAVAANDVDPPDEDGSVSRGIRVPVIVASPWTHADPWHGPRIHSHLFDHTSILKLIEWRWRLPHLTLRDAPDSNITNLAHVLDFRRHDPRVPRLPTSVAPVIEACPPAFGPDNLWKHLRASPLAKDWKL